ncbi:DUF2142 domain-containing protein [Kamptonema formosum]|uniref:DUF2142 domain-containing protein n=1 Tax=Kamptonema formosum TaxID=331992 RepID=UPI00034B3F06|nr:DUF2142 domain-containing protein [Oscillatoria sp. PCC 10802]
MEQPKILSSPATAFLAIGLCFGLIFLFLTPPFQVPDEQAHFYRAYQISEGHIVAQKRAGECAGYTNNFTSEMCVGGLLPTSLLTTVRSNKPIRFHPQNKQNPQDIFNLLKLPLEPQDRTFLKFPGSALYSHVPYLPQALAIAVGRLAHASPLALMYAGRLFNLMAWLGLEYLAIRIAPAGKWLLFLICLTPMSLFQAASLSADAVTNGLAHLLIAVFLKSAIEEDKPVERWDVALIFSLSLLLALSKQLYLPFVGMFLWVPVKKFGNLKTYLLTLSTLLLICLTGALSWSYAVRHLYAFNPAGSQISFILSQPLNFASILLNTLAVRGYDYLQEFIGKLGWLDTPLPAFHIWSYMAVLVIVALAGSNSNVALTDRAKAQLQTGAKTQLQTGAKTQLQTVGLKPNYKQITGIQKAVAFSIFALNSLLMFILMYLSWNPVGALVIEGIQGRYFLPLAPLFFLVLSNPKVRLNMKTLTPVIPFYTLFSATLTIAVLFQRYYG